jgi:hypothetical protein
MEISRWPAELHPRLVPFPIVLLLTALPADARGGPEVAIHTMFPKPGRYKLWGQFKRGDNIIVADFVVNVEKPLLPAWFVNALLFD